MSAESQILLLALGVGGILLALTLIGEGMRMRPPRGASAASVETFNTRVQSWWAMVLLLALALLAGRWGVVALFAVAAFAALREYLTLSVKARGDHLTLAAAFYLILPAQFLFVGFDWPQLFAVLVPVYAFLGLPVLSLLRGGHARFLGRVAETQWGLMICVFCASHIPALMTLDIPGHGARAVLLIPFLFLVVQGAELLDYFLGRRIGRRRIRADLAPRTWEGFWAALACAALIGAGLAWITPFGPALAALLAVLAAAAGLMGGLVLIAIKRDKGVADWSHLIPGQGGFLDQLGGVMVAAPVLYHLVRLLALP